ncbi:MAG TPA: tetratricopeptide repeat protein [Vicinamibacterales bacterium]|jgi:tetratricopeptide (TPR) repeat protein
MTRPVSFFLLFAALVFTALSGYGTAQTARRPLTPLQMAVRALNEGRYDEVDAAADKLDLRDPSVVAVKARAAIARGRYQQADTLLRPVAQRAPSSDAALELGLLGQLLSKDDAIPMLEKVASLADTSSDGREVARAARALRALGRFQEANAAYREAAGELPADPAIQTAWGDLFLEKYNKTEAIRSYQLALQFDSSWTPALMGSARALGDDNPPQANALVKRVLQVNPASVDAHLFLAEQSVDASKYDEARKSIDQALTTNPSSLDARALLAALEYVQDNTSAFESETTKVLSISPRHGDVYRRAGELAARNYRFDEAVTLTRRALTLDPADPRAQADLGMHLLRTGDEPGARTALEASFKSDPYDVVTLNLLKMLDTLDAFVTVRDGDVIMRMSKDEAPVLQEYAIPLAHQALNTLSERYQFKPQGPILIEIFPKHDDFAVRNLGLPGMIGALGACFGRVVTLDSPRARPPGEFQWEATLWHELAHVITIQMSSQRIPRWLTEGISVYEEKRARPEWGREMDVEFASMLNRGETLKLKDLNGAFQNPATISLAYFQASLVVDHIVAKYGDGGLRQLVSAYAKGVDTDAALKAALNTDFETMQAGFDASVEQTFGTMRKALAVPDGVPGDGDLLKAPLDALQKLAADHAGSYPVQVAYGRALRKAGRTDDAMQAFERAAALVPVARGKGSPHEEMAAIALEKKDRPRAIAELTALVANDFDNVEAARQLADLLKQDEGGAPAKLQPVYQRIAAIDPFDATAHAALGRMAMERNDPEFASREFRTVIALNPVDRALAYTDLAESYYKSGKKADAKKQTLLALEIAPTYERAQELLLKLVDNQP